MGYRLQVCAIAIAASACDVQSGSIDLILALPPSGDLRPTGMTTVGITEVASDGTSSVTTTPLIQDSTGMHFSAGDVAAGKPLVLSAELHDPSNRLVGYGAVAQAVTPSATDVVSVTLPVRKPIVYVVSDMPIATIDPTRDTTDTKYQGQLGPTGVVVVPIDGTEIAVVTTSGVQRFATATHQTVGNAIPINFGQPLDAAPVPGQRRIVVGTTSGIAVVDIDGNKVTTFAGSKADRVAVGVAGGVATAYVLSGRVTPPSGMGTCGGSSSVFSIAIDSPGAQPMAIPTGGAPLSDVSADGAVAFVSNPCAGSVTRVDNGKSQFSIAGAGVLAVEGNRLWAAGSMPPVTTPSPLGARITLESVGVDGSDTHTVQLPPKSELVYYTQDSQQELSIELHADTEIPIDMVVLPSAGQVALITRMDTHRAARGDQFGTVIPEMLITVYDVVLADTVTGAATRIRALCNLQVINGGNAEFPTWACAVPNESELPAGPEYTPTTVGAVYGGR